MRDDCGLQPSAVEPCLFIGENIILLLYVDDGMVFAPTDTEAEAFLALVGQRFDIKRLGAPRHFLGWTVSRDKDGNFHLHQRGYIESMYNMYGSNIRDKATPMVYGATLPDEGTPGDTAIYREIIGSLLFASIGTRPDITTAVSMLSRHMATPTKAHVTAARNVIAYLAATPELGLRYKAQGEPNIEVYCDASFASEEYKRKSRTGWVILVNGTPVAWKSSLQPVIAHSTAESEYIAMSDAAREAIYIRRLLEAMHSNIDTIKVYEDNQVAKRMAEEIATKRSKHIDVRYHHIRELVEAGDIIIEECRTDNMLADMLTKPLPKEKFRMLRDRMMAKGEC